MYLDQEEMTFLSTYSHSQPTRSVNTRRNQAISSMKAYKPYLIISLTVFWP